MSRYTGQIADERLYAAKRSDRRSPGRQRAVLLQVLNERNPGLGTHVHDVGELAANVGELLGLAPDELELVRQAGQLHDIGKMAIPDAILAKPGSLDDSEWEFVRQHTIIGERIVSAAPALGPVAALVRSSHERWGGTGYPDGLAGAETLSALASSLSATPSMQCSAVGPIDRPDQWRPRSRSFADPRVPSSTPRSWRHSALC